MKSKLLYLAMMLPGMASAQVFLDQTQAESGSYYKGVLTVTQGCDGSPTTAITVDIPEGLQFAQPMPKAGWQLEIVKKPVERPFFKDGIEITEAVRQITWSGNTLSDNHFDEFIFRGRIGVGATSVLTFPVTQKCEAGELHWDQIAETKASVKTRPTEPVPDSVIEMIEDTTDEGDEKGGPKAHQHQHQHGQDNATGKQAQPKAHQHQHQHGQTTDHGDHTGHDMEMSDETQMDHSAHANHAGHGQPSLPYPAPSVRVVDGTGEHHHH